MRQRQSRSQPPSNDNTFRFGRAALRGNNTTENAMSEANMQAVANALAVTKIKDTWIPDPRAMIVPGKYRVDVAVRINGTINVGEDYDTAPTVSIPLKETLALFIAYSGITRQAAITALRRAMVDSIAESGCGQGALSAALPVVDETMATVQNEIINQLPRQPRKGSVTTKLTVQELGMVI